MIRLFTAFVISAALLFSPGLLHAATDAEVLARKNALDLAGAFANDGFKLRDGHWLGKFEKGKAQIIQVNLYAGNEYWFALAAGAEGKKLAVSIYDEAGVPQEFEQYAKENTAAAGFAPEASGPYYVKVEQLDGEAATFCLLYSYK